jgi:hypothetical protein
MGDGGLARALRAHPHRAAAAAFGLLVLAYLWPALLGGKVLTPSSLLYEQTPWAHLPRPAGLPPFNEELVDVPTAIYPWRFFARAMLHAGTFPAWNPHVFAGAPFYANPANGLFSPFSLPLWILPLSYGIGVGAALKLWAAGFGCYLLARELRLGLLPGLLAGVGFAFSALNVVWLTHESLPAVAAMLPWTIWLVERIFRGGRLPTALGLAAVTAIAIGGGHAGMQVHILAAAGLYALLRAAPWSGSAPRAERLRALALAYGGLVAGALLMAVILIPEVLSSRDTIGTAARHGGRGTLPGTFLPPGAIKSVLFPDWWGRGGEATEVPGPANYNERTFYAGVVTLLLGCTGLLAPERWRRKAPFLALGAIGLAVPLHAPGLYWLATHLPVLADVQSQRLHFLYAFAVSVLAAFGLQALLERPGRRRWLLVPLGALLLGGVLLAAVGGDWGRVVRHVVTGATSRRRTALASASVVWFLLFALGVGALVLAAWRWPRRRVPLAALVVLLAALDMLHFAHGYQPMAPAAHAFPPRTPAIAFLQRHERDGRVVGTGATLGFEWSGTYGLDDVRGYEPPQPSVRLYRLWKAAEPAQTNWQPFAIDRLTTATVRLASVLGARYVASPPSRYPRLPVPGLRTLARVYHGRDASVFENPNALPRALVASRVTLTADEQGTRAALLDERFDPRRAVVVEQDQPGASALAGSPPVHGTAAVTHETDSRVTLRAALDRRGLVLLDDALADGWSVRVDGRAARAIRVDDVLRGVVVERGRHDVTWSYAVPGLAAGAAVTVSALIGLLATGIALAVRAGRPR